MAHLDPGAFAFVMATGIVSTALRADGSRPASRALLLVAVVGYALLLVAYGWRLLRWRQRFLTDLVGPRGFAFLTIVAASNVLASRIVADGHVLLPAALLAFGALLWLLLGYGIPIGLIASSRRELSLDQVNGTWFIWVVGTESVAVASAALARLVSSPALADVASVLWAIGLVQYLLTAATALARLLVRPVSPKDLIPAYWVFMGAAAITVLAGARLLELPPDSGLLPRPVVAGLSLIVWSFGSWLIPLLLLLGVWRHLLRRVPLRYETGWWGIVFPVGMYTVATRELGRVTGTSWLEAVGRGEVWIAAAVWLLVFAAMLAGFAGAGRGERQPRSEA
ncbi:tellurite resistance/C4-dicarboxylate transporter family protein [Streptomyces sp. TP-A0874]|uniref:tellurite resistance/C4-dicarboxylate transporter family protein n=1 Tax=Streptomyces sp. TP-A0874 TaxID=549819 RepID=UPI000AB579DE|nr:tellurite resistance/C4-dicarboxylate transporter family protein [Streptomyces sp. TP-A0874]